MFVLSLLMLILVVYLFVTDKTNRTIPFMILLIATAFNSIIHYYLMDILSLSVSLS
ncbi:hypothetical protein KVP40.0172 [Vibrio phage KVP40]|uniref:Uncharacterized protein n=1 Tax=Vibrio phage KVP40 (isolate Vibrio parahaemolyticus/Japan/Matsuzaki/1991) TaxID=75320 RepID=Q6WHY2_BPKVM|nr:hypothetical protein KVP40.0172 [Vibrio phage KVP40]AAQ64241.1 hypothetical protein KVP40.0172 [Vibrio phage KVP40]WOL24705.1 hypothetical protein [Vibrio phage PG216]